MRVQKIQKKPTIYTPTELPVLFNTNEIANYLGVCVRTVHNLLKNRTIPVIRVGGITRFDPIKVREVLNKYEIDAVYQKR